MPWSPPPLEHARAPQVGNIYMEMGSTFAMMVSSNPLLAAYVMGMIIDAFGPEHVLWGTDSIWWGSPQWQIEAFRRLEMPDQLMRRFWVELPDGRCQAAHFRAQRRKRVRHQSGS